LVGGFWLALAALSLGSRRPAQRGDFWRAGVVVVVVRPENKLSLILHNGKDAIE